MGKYNWHEIYVEARGIAHDCDGWRDLARTVGVPRRTLRDGLRREFNIKAYSDLVDDTEKYNVSRGRYEVAKIQAKQDKYTWLKDAITNAVTALDGHKVHIPENTQGIAVSDEAIIALIGDWHWGQKTGRALMGEYPEYDTHIADRRLGQYFTGIADTIESTKVNTVYLAMLGDEVEGSEIRDTQTRVISSGIVTQMLQFFSILASYVEDLVVKFPDIKIQIIGVPGNHTRLTKSKSDVIPTETMDYCGYNYMVALLRGLPNIWFNLSESWHIYEKICGYGFYFMHGDGVRAYRGLPAYGLTRAGHSVQSCLLIEDKMRLRDNPNMLASDIRFVDYMITGHFHSDNMLEDVDIEIITNGSPTGTSPYAAKDLRRAARPSQTILVVNEDGVYCKIKKILK